MHKFKLSLNENNFYGWDGDGILAWLGEGDDLAASDGLALE
ncbi:MAG TPA: hypothetical protein VGY56_18220 [Verrucomicrobiae bacterium]|nr:hypothetical protein [Verrucomicrobiae bacterium]